MNDTYKLDQSWSLWYHSINDDNWKHNSYKKIIEINNLFDYQFMKDMIKNQYFHNSMFFFMKQNIFPTWEDKNNIKGSCISLKISSKDNFYQWNLLIKLLLTNSLFVNKQKNDMINGISISPKKAFNIVKIWFKDDIKNLKFINQHPPYIINKNYIYKKNKSVSS